MGHDAHDDRARGTLGGPRQRSERDAGLLELVEDAPVPPDLASDGCGDAAGAGTARLLACNHDIKRRTTAWNGRVTSAPRFHVKKLLKLIDERENIWRESPPGAVTAGTLKPLPGRWRSRQYM